MAALDLVPRRVEYVNSSVGMREWELSPGKLNTISLLRLYAPSCFFHSIVFLPLFSTVTSQ